MAGSKLNFRVSMPCSSFSDAFCTAFSDLLDVRGLKSLIFKNILLSIDTGDEDEIKKRLAAILTGSFEIVFTESDEEDKAHEPKKQIKKQGTVFDSFKEELNQFSNQFAKSLSAEDK